MIPKQLKHCGFCRIRKQSKIPFEKEWQKKPYSYEDIQKFRGENYGVVGGFNALAIIDCDETRLIKIVNGLLPKTFSVQTGGGGIHFYYFIPKMEKKIILSDEEGHLGEIQSKGAVGVGAGSLHPNGKLYEVKDDVGIKTISLEELKIALGKFMKGGVKKGGVGVVTGDVEDHKDLISNLVNKWNTGDRQELALSTAGYLRKNKRLGINKAKEIIQEVCRITEDEELNMRLRAVDETYKKDEKDIKGIKGLSEKGIKEKEELLLDGNGRSISDLARDISDLLENKNVLFYRPNSQQIVEVGKIKIHNTNEDRYTGFKVIKDKRLITLIEKYVKVGQMVKTPQGNFFGVKSLSPTKADIVLCSEIIEQALPQIERIFPIPLPIMYEEKLTFPKKGFDERFSSWRPMDSPEIDDLEMPIEKAKEIIEKVFSEFCFKKEQDKINAVAGLLTPFLRGLFNGFNTRTPIFFYMGNRERVGKDYCAGITGILYEGQAIDENPISSGDRSSNNNEELRKKITSSIITGKRRMHFANNKGYINNAIIEQVSTSTNWSDRLLGKNDLINLPNELDFSLSGNVGVTYTPDFANRCLFVNLFLDIEDANARGFDNPLLHEWVRENRGVILSALYSLVRNWIDNGKKQGSKPFASYPNWASVCGGVMESAGYSSPCVMDKDSLALAGDRETEDMKQLFEVCYETYLNRPVERNQIIKIVEKEEDIFGYIDFDKRSDQIKFWLKFMKYLGRILSGIRLEVVDSNVRSTRYRYIFNKMGLKK